MLKQSTLIFDLGGVLVPDPIEAAVSEIEGTTEANSIWVQTMRGNYKPIWNLADQGKISGIECIEGLRKQLTTTYATITTEEIIERSVASAVSGRQDYLFRKIERWRNEHHQTALFSNQIDVLAHKLTEALNLEQFFDVIVFSCFVGCKKNDPAIYAICADRLGGNEQEYRYFDDRLKNLPSAQARGWSVYHVTGHPIPL